MYMKFYRWNFTRNGRTEKHFDIDKTNNKLNYLSLFRFIFKGTLMQIWKSPYMFVFL